MKKGTSGELTMAKISAGEQCGACHNGKKEVAGKVVFLASDKANCERCIRDRSGRIHRKSRVTAECDVLALSVLCVPALRGVGSPWRGHLPTWLRKRRKRA